MCHSEDGFKLLEICFAEYMLYVQLEVF